MFIFSHRGHREFPTHLTHPTQLIHLFSRQARFYYFHYSTTPLLHYSKIKIAGTTVIVKNPAEGLTMQAYIVDNPGEKSTMQTYIVDKS